MLSMGPRTKRMEWKFLRPEKGALLQVLPGVQIDSTYANLTQLEVSEKLVQCVRSVVGVPQAYLMLLGAYVSRPCRQPQKKVT